MEEGQSRPYDLAQGDDRQRKFRDKAMYSRKCFLYVAILPLFLVISGYTPLIIAGDSTPVSTMPVERVKQLLGKPDTVIIDVRKPRSWWRSSKKILSAVREEPSNVDQWASKYTKDQTLIFY